GGEVARRAVVAGDDQSGALGVLVRQRRDQVRAHARRHERALGLLARGVGERAYRRVFVCVGEELPERHGAAQRAARHAARLYEVILERVSISSPLSSIPAAPRFSSRCSAEEVPGIGSITGERWSSHASATWDGVASWALAISSSGPPD